MTEFTILLLTLFFASLVTFRKESSFSKEKMPALKFFMAIVIVLGHLSIRVPSVGYNRSGFGDRHLFRCFCLYLDMECGKVPCPTLGSLLLLF